MQDLLTAINYFKAKKLELHNSKLSPNILAYEMRLDTMLGILEEAGISKEDCEIEQIQRGFGLFPKIDFSIGEYDFMLIMQQGDEIQLRHNSHHVILRNPLQEFSAVSLKRHFVEMAIK
jgi:hypothetical protein